MVVFWGGPCAQGAAGQRADVVVSTQRVEKKKEVLLQFGYKKMVVGGFF